MGTSLLIVEDDQSLLEILRDEFAKAGFKVAMAHDGEEGLKVATEQPPALILIDIFMPKMDGITMLKKIRATPQGKNIPVIILTNLNDNQTIDRALESGAYDFLVKSDWNPKDLVKRVKEKLGIKAE
jgi:DNA-binding response OmpR family regulator